MNYLDYSATTPVDPRVLERFVKENQSHFANPNSQHRAGLDAKRTVDAALASIRESLPWNGDVIPVSGATEANNLAILGAARANVRHGRHVITTAFEHSSATACFQQLQKEGFEVDIVDHQADGTVDLESLIQLLRPDTILVSVVAVQSEIGFAQPLKRLGETIHRRSKALFHTDATQALGKIELDLSEVDLASVTAHKIYGLKGIGALLVRESVRLEPQILGGHSTSVYRAGTPSAPLIDSLAYAVRLAVTERESRVKIVQDRLARLLEGLAAVPGCVLNRTSACVPQIVNFSLPPLPAKTLQAMLSDQGILISTQSACRQDDQASLAVLRLWDSPERARSSVRVSLSHLTTAAQIEELIRALGKAVLA